MLMTMHHSSRDVLSIPVYWLMGCYLIAKSVFPSKCVVDIAYLKYMLLVIICSYILHRSRICHETV